MGQACDFAILNQFAASVFAEWIRDANLLVLALAESQNRKPDPVLGSNVIVAI